MPAAAHGAVELRLAEIAPADERENVAAARIDDHERGLEVRRVEAPQPVRHDTLGQLLQFGNECGPDLPVRRMIAAELVAKLLAQKFLRVATPGIGRAGKGRDTNARRAGRPFLCLGDEALLAHPREDHVAAFDRAIEVGPWRERGRGSGEPRDKRALGEVQCFGGPSEQVPRHRFDAVDACAEIDAVEIELENLPLGQLRVDHQREGGLADLAAVRLLVRQEQRAGELLRERAAPFDRARRTEIAVDRAAERNRIDARVNEEAVILDGDERVLEVGRDVGKRHVLPVLVHPKPPAAVGREEPRVADAEAELMNGPCLTKGPRQRHGRQDDERPEDDRSDSIAWSSWDLHCGWARRACNASESTV